MLGLSGIVTVAIVSTATWGWCSDSTNTTDPLLDLFIKKGFVTQQEAEQVEAEAAFNRTNQFANVPAPSSQWKITKGIQKVELFGDVRLRYEDRYAADPFGNSIDLQRWRYSVRVGLRGEAFDDFYYGLRLETGANPRSSFVTIGTSTSSGAYQGPFGKSNAGINVGQAYLGWRPWDWVNVTVGKMPNPLYTTPMVWSGNINPEGAAERFKYDVGPAEFFATFGQFLYADLNPNSASPGLGINSGLGQNTDNIFMFAWQAGFDYHVTTNTLAKIAATVYNYTGLQQSSVNTVGALSPYFGDPYIGEGASYLGGGLNNGNPPNPAVGSSGYSPGQQFNSVPGFASTSYPLNQVGLNNLLVLEIPFEFDFKISQLDAQVFGDAAYNLDGEQRAEAAAAGYQTVLNAQINPPSVPHAFPAQTQDVKAYQIGFDLASQGGRGLVYGTTSKKNAWEIRTYWQHIEQYALDPNLLDTDFFEGQENLQGVYAALAYSFTDNFIGTFRYGHASRINDLLGTGGSGQDIPQINPIDNYNIYQVDLTFRF
jgi:Putative porin